MMRKYACYAHQLFVYHSLQVLNKKIRYPRKTLVYSSVIDINQMDVIFSAINISSGELYRGDLRSALFAFCLDYQRFSHEYGISSLFLILENTILVLSRGGAFAPYFYAPPCRGVFV